MAAPGKQAAVMAKVVVAALVPLVKMPRTRQTLAKAVMAALAQHQAFLAAALPMLAVAVAVETLPATAAQAALAAVAMATQAQAPLLQRVLQILAAAVVVEQPQPLQAAPALS